MVFRPLLIWYDSALNWASTYALELCFALLVTFLASRYIDQLFVPLERTCRKIARRRTLALAIIFFGAIGLRLALLPLFPIPTPRVQDEFSQLLGADTFAHGRLTNPPHPMWKHFETFHVNFQPTYHSMYPPAQALFMAAGKVLGGQYWYGVLVSMALMCAAITWALMGWMSCGWALIGGVLSVLQLCAEYYWMNSYWGGGVAAFGGALVLGAVPRLRRDGRVRDALLLAFGALILANSRSFEGFVLCVPLFIGLTVWWAHDHINLRRTVLHVVLPCIAFLAVGAAGMVYYNTRTTQQALEMPYQLNQIRYHMVGPLWWQQPRAVAPHYDYPAMGQMFFSWEYEWYVASHRPGGFEKLTALKLKTYHEQLFTPFAIPLLLGLFYLVRSRNYLLLSVSVLFTAALLIETYRPMAHYAAPATALVILLIVYGLRTLRLWCAKAHLGMQWSRAILLVFLAWRMWTVQFALDYSFDGVWPEDWSRARARIVEQLDRTPGKHLVLVHYSERHSPHLEWVYNAPDIDSSKIVWARELGSGDDEELLRYYPDRQVWRVYADSDIPRPEPYQETISDQLFANYLKTHDVRAADTAAPQSSKALTASGS